MRPRTCSSSSFRNLALRVSDMLRRLLVSCRAPPRGLALRSARPPQPLPLPPASSPPLPSPRGCVLMCARSAPVPSSPATWSWCAVGVKGTGCAVARTSCRHAMGLGTLALPGQRPREPVCHGVNTLGKPQAGVTPGLQHHCHQCTVMQASPLPGTGFGTGPGRKARS